MIINITEHKKHKKLKKIVTDLERVHNLLNLISKGLDGYKKYLPVKSVLHTADESRQMVKIHLDKFKEQLAAYEKSKLD